MKETPLPFLLIPAGKDYLWGGTRLKTEYHKESKLEPLAESWECSTHPDGVSKAGSGEHQGQYLTEILKTHPEYFGSRLLRKKDKMDGELPILIKLIDAKKDLSVQVHPDDTYAKEKENGSLGKTEFWYVLQAEPDASLVYGFNRHLEKEELKKSLTDGTVEQYLNKVNVKKGDGFLIPAGTVHAIGAGAVIAEIQENSNITYRLFDYNRVSKDGKKRELHVDKSLEVANRDVILPPSVNNEERAAGIVCRCPYFEVMLHKTDISAEPVSLPKNAETFQVLLCCEGEGVISIGTNFSERIEKGDSFFVPANTETLCVKGRLSFLQVFC